MTVAPPTRLPPAGWSLIPTTIRVDRDQEAESTLTARVREWLSRGSESRAAGWHASDLLEPLKAYWRRREPLPLTDRDAGIFLVGKVLHAFILAAVDGRPSVDLTASDEGSQWDEALGIHYSPDRREGVRPGTLAEIKTSRSLYEPRTVKDLETYTEQLLVYMACEQRTAGELWVLYLNAKDTSGKTAPAFRVYRVVVTPETLSEVRQKLQARKALLEEAVASGDPTALPLCAEWKCHPERCGWWESCRPPGRYETGGAA
jgi:hypothetical protein